jgi:hypothetical protein
MLCVIAVAAGKFDQYARHLGMFPLRVAALLGHLDGTGLAQVCFELSYLAWHAPPFIALDYSVPFGYG